MLTSQRSELTIMPAKNDSRAMRMRTKFGE